VLTVSGVGVVKRKKKMDGSLTQCQALSRNCSYKCYNTDLGIQNWHDNGTPWILNWYCFNWKCKVWTEQLSKILLDKRGIHTGIQVFFHYFCKPKWKIYDFKFSCFLMFQTYLMLSCNFIFKHIIFYPLFLQVWQIDFTQRIFSHLVCLP
jgi:hypothetical protein